MARSRRAEATALAGWLKPQLTRLVDTPPDAEGPISGLVNNGVYEFKGIPYAAPPIGELDGSGGHCLVGALLHLRARSQTRCCRRRDHPRSLVRPIRSRMSRSRKLSGTDGSQTPRWSKGDSNSWSHPERQRSEGATWVPPLLPVSESRPPEKRQRSAELSATASAVATPFHVGVPNAHTPIALSSIVRIASIVTGSFRLSSMRRTRMGLHDGNWT